MPNPTCSAPECDSEARSPGAAYCKMHYHRVYRHGSLDANFGEGFRTATPRSYRSVYAKGHPTASKNGKAYVHRKMLYDAIGEGPHPCHWCGKELQWFVGKGKPDNLNVDHLNGDKGDNRFPNLVASCGTCNAGRANQERSKYLRESLGAWSGNDTVAALRNPKTRRKPSIIEARQASS